MRLHTHLKTYATQLILEEEAKRLYKTELHALGEPTDIVVALDDRTRDAEGFDDVRINGPLAKPLNVLELVCLFIEDLDEATTDDLTLLFGISDTLES